MDSYENEASKFAAQRTKLKNICEAHDLTYTFIKNSKGNKFGLEAFFSVNNLFDNNRETVYSNEAAGVGDGGYHSQIYIHSGRKASIGLRARF